jgi:hypothetical protein
VRERALLNHKKFYKIVAFLLELSLLFFSPLTASFHSYQNPSLYTTGALTAIGRKMVEFPLDPSLSSPL